MPPYQVLCLTLDSPHPHSAAAAAAAGGGGGGGGRDGGGRVHTPMAFDPAPLLRTASGKPPQPLPSWTVLKTQGATPRTPRVRAAVAVLEDGTLLLHGGRVQRTETCRHLLDGS